jgi:catechol-2,3-dioxygenase
MTDTTNAMTDTAGALALGVAAPGYRLPADMRLGEVRLQVADLQRSLDYYQRVLGLRLVAGAAPRAT